jgi:HEAT repeat protein
MKHELIILRGTLRHCETDAERVIVIQAITATCDPDAVPLLIRALDNDDDEVARVAIDGLVSFGERAVPALQRLRGSPSADGSYLALLAMARLGDVDACRRIAEMCFFADDGPLAAAPWLIGCGRLGIETLAQCDWTNRHVLRQLIGHRLLTEPVLLRLVGDGGHEPPRMAIAALAHMGTPAAVAALRVVARDRRRPPFSRRLAIVGLADERAPECIRLLRDIAATRDEDEWLRAECVEMLARLASAA